MAKKFFGINQNFVIFLFFLLVIFLRFWQISFIPPGLNRDEASIGYTAWSILKTGKDEYGQLFPLSIKSFGDWKLPASVYSTIPFVAIFGLNNWTIRLPFFLAGLVTLVLTYLLTKELFKNKQYSLWTFVFLSLLPWHFHFSRYGHEGTIGLMFLTGAILFFLKGLKNESWLILSAVFFGLTLYSYYTYFIFTPIFLVGLILIYHRHIKEKLAFATIALAFFITLITIILRSTLGGAQVKSSIFYLNDPVTIHSQIEIPRLNHGNSPISKLIYNRPIVFSRLFFIKYLATFGPQFLIIKGGEHPLHNFPGLANLFWFQYPLFLIGIISLIKKKNISGLLIIWWLLITPIGSSLTKDAPNSGRVSPMIIPLVICVSIGFVSTFRFFKKGGWEKVLIFLTSIIFIQGIFSLYQNYFINFPEQRGIYWGAGYQKLVNYLNLSENQQKNVIMQRPNYSPYIYFLFYSKYNPLAYQKEAQRYPPASDGFFDVKGFSRYQFTDFKLADQLTKKQLVIVWAETVTSESLKKISPFLKTTIKDNDQIIFYVFEGIEK